MMMNMRSPYVVRMIVNPPVAAPGAKPCS